MLSTAGAVAAIAVMAIITFLTRALPFLLFDRGESPPKLVLYLAGFCHRPSSPCSSYTVSGACPLPPPALGAPARVRGGGGDPHLWRSNTLLSIFGGTILYMVLVQAVFP